MVGGSGTKLINGIARSKIDVPNLFKKMSSLHLSDRTKPLKSQKSLKTLPIQTPIMYKKQINTRYRFDIMGPKINILQFYTFCMNKI